MPDGRDAAREWNGSEVAVIGLAGRFPGAATVEQLWENLRAGVESIRFFSEEELAAAGVSASRLAHPSYVKAAPVLDGIDLFDASLFGIPPREAQIMDPQHRLFLECAWEALERAGYDGERFRGLVGVYAGLDMNTYLWNLASNAAVMEAAGAFQLEIASDKDYLASRVSYKLSLGGPSLTVQAACSTSLVAIHLACQGLLSGECDMALAGGVTIKVPQIAGYLAHEGAVHSPDGHCRAFDADAQGTVFGSGLGIVVLKRLTDALADGDVIHAVIKGSAVNNDGSLKIGYTAPGADGQAKVVRAALHLAEVDPATITYIEAHGTGTPLGDPIEVSALTQAFRASTDEKGYCAIGSVKTNVGHLKAAAGVTGLIKTVLALKHRELPPSLHLQRPNPHIDFANSPFYVNDRLRDWVPAPGAPRRAAVSSFGVGGTNAHVILEEAPPAEPSGPSRPWQILLLSANSETALAALRTNLADHLRRHPDLPLADVAHTLQVGRRDQKHRASLVAESVEDAIDGLTGPDRVKTAFQEQRDRPVIFLFPGQGAQHPGMARAVYETEPVFRDGIDRCCEILRPLLGLDLRDLLFPQPETLQAAEQRLEQTALAQPALFVVEHSLAQLWMSWGVRPRAMLGHSLGEYVAACLSGVFSLEDALALVAERGRLMQERPAGDMLSVPLPEAEVAPRLTPGLSIAAVNGPARLVVSGPEDEVAALEADLQVEGIACRRLHTSHAFHSSMMDPVLESFARRVASLRRGAPRIPFASNSTGTWITAEEAADPQYWACHLRGAVRFADGLRTLGAEPDAALLEVGPGQTLASFVKQNPGHPAGWTVVRSLPHPKEGRGEGEFLAGSLGQLWLAGVTIDWQGYRAGESRKRVELPAYPFERQRYWVDFTPASAGPARPNARQDLADWFYVPVWKPSVPPVAPDSSSHWLLLVGPENLGETLARRLTDGGHTATRESDPPMDRDGYNALFERLKKEKGLPRHIVYMVTSGFEPEAGFHSLVALAQALVQAGALPCQLRVVTEGLQSVAGEPVRAPGQALLLGPVRVLPLEHPEIGCAAIDVVLPQDTAGVESLADLLIAEALAEPLEPVVAYRGEDRWTESFEPLRLPALDGSAARRLPLREKGVYLITGGLGGIGLALAGELARAVRARLVLTGRSALPAREDRIRQIAALEDAGAEVLVLTADVTDEDAMRRAVELARERFGALHGVIHAAGVPSGGVIALKTPEAADRVLAPKVRGTRVLESVLADEPLDLFLLCSSTYAVTGGVGQVDYCAANAFLEAFARQRNGRNGRNGGRTVALGWGPWQEVGMAADAAAARRAPARAELIPDAWETAEGGEPRHPLLGRRLASADGAVSYSTVLSPEQHWILSEHRILGTPAAPGTSYLEMARAAFSQESGAAGAELRDVSFVSPLLVAEGETREVRTLLEDSSDGTRFRVVSRTAEGAGWQDHARGRLLPVVGPPPDRRSLEELAARCNLRVISGGGQAGAREGLVSWGPRWQSVQRASLGNDEALVTLELPPEFAGDLDSLGLHPALLDVATAFGGGLISGGNLLPQSYRLVRVHAPLPAKLHAHIRRSTPAAEGTIALDVTLLDVEGGVRVEVEGFTMKQVGGEARPEPRGEARGAAEWIRPHEGVEAVRRVLARGRFAQVAVSPVDLPAAIAAMRREAAQRTAAPAETARFPRPSLGTAYSAPGNPTEAALAAIWQSVLGLEQVGTQDNFFDLGGDSVVAIQVIAQAAQQGLHLSPEQLFEHQTVAALARLLDGTGSAPAISAPAPVPASPDPVDTAAPAPSDFPDADLSQESLDRLFARVRNLPS